MEYQYKQGDKIFIHGKGYNDKERLIIRKRDKKTGYMKFYSLDTYTGNVVDVYGNQKEFDSAKELVEAYQKDGYKIKLAI